MTKPEVEALARLEGLIPDGMFNCDAQVFRQQVARPVADYAMHLEFGGFAGDAGSRSRERRRESTKSKAATLLRALDEAESLLSDDHLRWALDDDGFGFPEFQVPEFRKVLTLAKLHAQRVSIGRSAHRRPTPQGHAAARLLRNHTTGEDDDEVADALRASALVSLARPVPMRRAGRPADERRNDFCFRVAEALRASGLEPKAWDGGTFSKILTLCFEAAGAEPPNELKASMRGAVRKLKELDAADEEIAQKGFAATRDAVCKPSRRNRAK